MLEASSDFSYGTMSQLEARQTGTRLYRRTAIDARRALACGTICQ